MSFLKQTEKALKHIEREEYMSASLFLYDNNTRSGIENFHIKSEDSVNEDDLNAMKNIIIICKSISEVNEYMSGILFRLIPDWVYDSLIERYKHFRDEQPFPNTIPSGMRSVDQDFPELSGTLDKAYEVYDISDKPSVEKWLKKIFKQLGVNNISLIIAPKFDGTSVTVTYKRHHSIDDEHVTEASQVKAITRGDFDNNRGVDLFNIIMTRCNPPYHFDWRYNQKPQDKIIIPNKFGVQYEAMITEYGREKLSKVVGITYSTRRAAIASALKRLSNPKTSFEEVEEINKCITLVPLMVDNGFIEYFSETEDFSDIISDMHNDFYLADNESSLEYNVKNISGSIDILLEKIQEIVVKYAEKRNKLNYSIDGLVLTIADHKYIKTIGRSNNINKWQIAYKFDAIVQRTKITGIISTMGNQGYVGHNITFEPIEFNGVVYDKAPISTVTRFKLLNPHIGDEVLVSYNADVMGYIYRDKTCKRNKNGEAIDLPMTCLNCAAPLVIHKDMLKCLNEDCSGNKIGRLLETVRVLGLDYFGEQTCIDLVEKANITNTIEFIQMKHEDLAKVLKGLNFTNAWYEFKNKINNQISYSKIIDLLRIPSLRTKTAEKIIKHIGINELIELLVTSWRYDDNKKLISALKKVPGINKNSKNFADGLVNKYSEFNKLRSILKCVDDTKDKKITYDKVVMVSGFRNNDDFIETCNRLNYNIIETGSKFDMLVITPDRMNGKKAVEARKKNIPIVTLAEFIYQHKE
jgi:NAD-dependent DNA ligase